MSKRTMILLAIGLIALAAAFFSQKAELSQPEPGEFFIGEPDEEEENDLNEPEKDAKEKQPADKPGAVNPE